MYDMKSRKSHESEKPFPGCMGRMVNLFDLGMTGNKLLMEKAHRDGYTPQGQKDVTKKLEPIRDRMEERPVENELKRSTSNRRLNGTPVKMLIAQEMSKEIESKQKPPTVVAKLMGLDGLPALQPISTLQQSSLEGHSHIPSNKSGVVSRHEHDNNQEKAALRDVHEVRQQSSRNNRIKDQPQQRGGRYETSNENKMALVRQKFLEAKRLAMDEKLRQSKEFQDALEVLSSNRDLFLKFLQEPNSLFSKHLHTLQSTSTPNQPRHITVLKPSKTVETDSVTGVESKSEMHFRKQHQVVEASSWDSYKEGLGSAFDHHRADNASQPTRIVVLKPSLGKTHDIKAVSPSPTSSPRLTLGRSFCTESESGSVREPREIAKEITRQMQVSLRSEGRDESLLSSILSNGYVGDESSFNQSENDCTEYGNISDLETVSSISRHSWECVNRFSDPSSSSSFSRASCSPESSVTREAKKRLSERLAMMSSTETNQEQRRICRSSSTLGEMLILSDIKKPIKSEDGVDDGEPCVSSSWLCHREEQLRMSIGCSSGSGGSSPTTLSRSRSVPTSSTAYEIRSSGEVYDCNLSKSITQNEMKPIAGKFSFKGKVSSLFFSRNKKPSKEKHCLPPSDSPPSFSSSIGHEPETHTSMKKMSVEDRGCKILECSSDGALEEAYSIYPGASFCKTPSPRISAESRHRTFPSEGVLSSAKTDSPEISSENQDQPSPISVLEAPFEDDANPNSNVKMGGRGLSKHRHPCESDSTEKSPIYTVTRSLSWDDGNLQTLSAHPLELSTIYKRESEEKERFLFIRTLLSAAGLDDKRLDANGNLPVDPLDLSLLDMCINDKGCEQYQNEARRRQWRSEQRLLFDCVGEALMDMSGYTSSRSWYPKRAVFREETPLVEEIYGRVGEWVSVNSNLQSLAESDITMQAERVVRKEVAVGKEWEQQLELDTDELVEEIERGLLTELIEEAIFAVAL